MLATDRKGPRPRHPFILFPVRITVLFILSLSQYRVNGRELRNLLHELCQMYLGDESAYPDVNGALRSFRQIEEEP